MQVIAIQHMTMKTYPKLILFFLGCVFGASTMYYIIVLGNSLQVSRENNLEIEMKFQLEKRKKMLEKVEIDLRHKLERLYRANSNNLDEFPKKSEISDRSAIITEPFSDISTKVEFFDTALKTTKMHIQAINPLKDVLSENLNPVSEMSTKRILRVSNSPANTKQFRDPAKSKESLANSELYLNGKIGDIFKIAHILDSRTEKLKEIHDFIYSTLDRLQNEGDCEKKKIIKCTNSVLSGFGSTVHRHVICLHIAFALDRIFFIDQPQYYRRDKFQGLAAFTQLETGKCAYLKQKSKTIKDKCNFKDYNCYLKKDGNEINNTYKLLEFTKEADFPAPKYIPRTLPQNMETALKDLGIKKPWHWFTSQLLGYLIMRPNEEFGKKFEDIAETMGLRHPVVGLHLRRGDKIRSEARLIHEKKYTDLVERIFTMKYPSYSRQVYLASDEKITLNITQTLLNHSSYSIKSSALVSKLRVGRRDDAAKQTMETILMELYFLVHCDYSIVTFSSNVGRLVWELRTSQYPYDLADERITSMDSTMFYGWYDYTANTKYYLTIRANSGTSLNPYKKGQLIISGHTKTSNPSDGKIVKLRFGNFRHSKPRRMDYVYEDDVIAWPGDAVYKNDIP